jgi:phosphatidylglycerophosphate synthase
MVKYNIANILTSMRLVCGPIGCWALSLEPPRQKFAAVVFMFGVLTDICDGFVARKFGFESPTGSLFDKTTDKIFLSCYLIPLACLGRFNGFAVACVHIGWFLVMLLRNLPLFQSRDFPPTLTIRVANTLVFISVFVELLLYQHGNSILILALGVGIISLITTTFGTEKNSIIELFSGPNKMMNKSRNR